MPTKGLKGQIVGFRRTTLCIARPSRRVVSVRLCVTFVYCIETGVNIIILKLFLPSRRTDAVVFPHRMLWQYSDGNRPNIDVDVDVERKQAQAIASLPDSITHYYAYSNEDITVISLRLPVP